MVIPLLQKLCCGVPEMNFEIVIFNDDYDDYDDFDDYDDYDEYDDHDDNRNQ